MNQPKKRVLIIGGGFSGAMTAVQLLRTGAPFSIVLFDAGKRPARGIAYSVESPEVLLNVPAARMSPIHDEPSAFIDWAKANSNHPLLGGREPSPAEFLPRGLYGAFLESLLERSLAANPKSSLDFVNGTVTSLEHSNGEWRACGKFNRIYSGEYAILALGNPPPTVPPQLEKLSPDRLVNPWNGLDFESLPLGDSVICVGSGLTAVDVVVRLHELGYKGTVHLCSRHGLVPNSHHSEPLSAPPGSLTGTKATLRSVIREVRREIRAVTAQGKPWQPVLDTLRPKHQELWKNFTSSERKSFIRHLSPYWEIHRHRVAPQLAALLGELEQAGRLTVTSGAIQKAEDEPQGIKLTVKQRGSGSIKEVRGSHLFICTGPARTVAAWENPVIEKLLASGELERDELGIGFRLSRASSGKGIFLLGSALRGTLWETTAARELSQQALNTAQSIASS